MALRVGDLVTVNASFLNEPSGVRAYVYESYQLQSHGGVSLITENLVDLGGFSLDEQIKYLSLVRSTGWIYKYRSSFQLRLDAIDGHFNQVFKKV